MKILLAVLAVLALVGGGTLYVLNARQEVQADSVVTAVITPEQLPFRDKSGQVALAPRTDPGGQRTLTGLHCDRFHFAAKTAVCLRVRAGALTPTTDVIVLDEKLHERQRVEIPGTPSRARVSPDGRIVAWTAFVTGDSYATTGFSTRAGLLDLSDGQLVKTIEELPVLKDGRRYFAADVNYWGITFARDNATFYATMASKGSTYLVRGDYPSYRGKVLRDNVECPSLSPDGSHLVFKKKVADGDQPWRLYTLDLATMRETPLAETHSVDDQAAWLDEHTVLYGLGGDVWAVPADGSGAPRQLIAGASSPGV
ncbi:PD40 domain-containing protein [Kutzneria viridogrisea]|uniref:WD40-like Beta Propeller Repeat n=1 Tax=Kutzneria viridogrisea TaxID=47990 RepID=A0ABR6BZE2_9PSEU|nr:hypothetical protein [Kutzneria viridogrisea]